MELDHCFIVISSIFIFEYSTKISQIDMHTRVQSDYIVKFQGNSIPFDEHTHPESSSIIQAFHVGRQCF